MIVGVFIWLLRENAELQRLKQSVTETVQTAESKQLQETLEKILQLDRFRRGWKDQLPETAG